MEVLYRSVKMKGINWSLKERHIILFNNEKFDVSFRSLIGIFLGFTASIYHVKTNRNCND